jgi:hypothetical protein
MFLGLGCFRAQRTWAVFRTVARNPTITFDVMNGANPTDPCAKNVISFLVFEKPPTPPYETTSKPFQIETARIHAID